MTDSTRASRRSISADVPLQGGAEDHLGFVVSPGEIARLGRACSGVEGIETKYLEDGVPSRVDTGASTFRTFFVRHALLALWFQFEAHEPT